MSDSLWPHGLKPSRILHPWDSAGKNTGVGCHFLLQTDIIQKYLQSILLQSIMMKIEFKYAQTFNLFQLSSVFQSCPTLCDPMNRSTPGLSVHHQLLESTQMLVHQVGDAMQPSHPLSPTSPPAFDFSKHQGLFQWVSWPQVAKILEFQLQHQSFQWMFRTDFL